MAVAVHLDHHTMRQPAFFDSFQQMALCAPVFRFDEEGKALAGGGIVNCIHGLFKGGNLLQRCTFTEGLAHIDVNAAQFLQGKITYFAIKPGNAHQRFIMNANGNIISRGSQRNFDSIGISCSLSICVCGMFGINIARTTVCYKEFFLSKKGPGRTFRVKFNIFVEDRLLFIIDRLFLFAGKTSLNSRLCRGCAHHGHHSGGSAKRGGAKNGTSVEFLRRKAHGYELPNTICC